MATPCRLRMLTSNRILHPHIRSLVHTWRVDPLLRNDRVKWQFVNVTTCHHSFQLQVSKLHTSCICYDEVNKHKSVVEKAADLLRESKTKEKEVTEVSKEKPPLMQRMKDAFFHTVTGFKLFWLDMKVSWRLLRKVMKGGTLTRRELKQFRGTLADIFRLVPFSVFIIVPFMEFLLPIYLYFFPNMLPSTFQSTSAKDARKRTELRMKLQMAQFLQDTIQEMSLQSKSGAQGQNMKEFAEFFEKIRSTGAQASTDDLLYFSKLFEDELTLDSLSKPQLVALAKLLLLNPIGSSAYLRFRLQLKLRQLEADDRMIKKEGVISLTEAELQSACQARGMRAMGLPIQRLQDQLSQWLDLHLDKQVPSSLLLLSRAFYLPENLPTEEALKATLSSLPEDAVAEAGLAVAASTGGTIDNVSRAKVILQQEQKIKEEEKEVELADQEKEKARQAKLAQAEMELAEGSAEAEVEVEDVDKVIPREVLKDLSQAVESITQSSLKEEKESLQELMEEKKEYDEDVQEVLEKLEVSKQAARLGKKVESMIVQLNDALKGLENEYMNIRGGDSVTSEIENRDQLVSTNDLIKGVGVLQGTSQEAKVRKLLSVMDEDHDGKIQLNDLSEVVELIGREETDLDEETLQQITQTLKKEDFWEKEKDNTSR